MDKDYNSKGLNRVINKVCDTSDLKIDFIIGGRKDCILSIVV